MIRKLIIAALSCVVSSAVAQAQTWKPPSEPTYTSPLATAGDERTTKRVGAVHSTAPVAASSA